MITFEQYYEEFLGDVRRHSLGEVTGAEAEGRTPDFKENAFTELMLGHLTERGVADGTTVCHYATKTTRGNIKLNAWAVDEEEGTATLCVTLYNGSATPTRISKSEADQALDQAVRAFEQAVDGFHKGMEPSSEAFGMMRRFCEARAEIGNVGVILLTDGLLPTELKSRRDRKGAYSYKYDAWDLQRLHRLVASDRPYEPVVIDLTERFSSTIPFLRPPHSAEDHSVFLAVLPGTLLCDLYDEFGSQLLDLNVRSFLQARGKVNKSIRDTLCKEPVRFLAYNNGISATAEKVEVVTNEAGIQAIKSLTGFQIVNGGQTMASIHRAAKLDKADISTVFVQAKITQVAPEKIEELAPLISRYANSQNKVNEADFSSNDPFNVELQRLSERIWAPGEQSRWFYERARGQYHVQKFREGPTPAKAKQFELKCPPTQRFSKTDMAKYLNCWDRLPHVVSFGAQKNFVHFIDSLRDRMPKDWQPDDSYYKDLIAKAILFRAADSIAREVGIDAYKANVVAYMVSLLSEKCIGRLDLAGVWNRQYAPDLVKEAFRKWAKPIYDVLVTSAGSRNVTEWCKKEACWKAVCAAPLDLPTSLREHLEDHQPAPTVGLKRAKNQGDLSSEDQENIARTMQVDAASWFKLSEWGRKKKKLKDWQCGIALTMGGYAQGGWDRVPSAKQAKQAVRILKTAEDEGATRVHKR